MFFFISTLFFTVLLSINIDTLKLSNKYTGGWPVYNGKDNHSYDMSIKCPGAIGCECDSNSDCVNNNCEKLPRNKYCIPKNGDTFPNFKAIDQYGDEVSLYDFKNRNKYILIEMGASWCSPCHSLANWLSFNDQEISNKPFWKNEYQIIYDLVQEDKIYFITILYEDVDRNNANYETLYDWFSMYPDEKIPILADSDKFLHKWIKPTGLPAVLLIDENMKINTFSSRGLNKAFDKIVQIFNDENE